MCRALPVIKLTLEDDLLNKNTRLAARNRKYLEERGLVAVNIMSSPGSGKTTLLERALPALMAERAVVVVEGDQATDLDADRIRATGCRTHQINTGTGCHLDADMVFGAIQALEPPEGALVIVENVGNLVCPALFDLGESARIVIASVTEGEDKPLKYPHMFRGAHCVVLNKTDLLPYVDFSAAKFEAAVRQVNPMAEIIAVSARSGASMDSWQQWLANRKLDLAL